MTDFQLWLDTYVDPDEPEEVRSLYVAVRDREPMAGDPWEITCKDNKIFIRLGDGDWLKLLSENAISTFLRMMDKEFGHDMCIEAWADCELAIANDKS